MRDASDDLHSAIIVRRLTLYCYRYCYIINRKLGYRSGALYRLDFCQVVLHNCTKNRIFKPHMTLKITRNLDVVIRPTGLY